MRYDRHDRSGRSGRHVPQRTSTPPTRTSVPTTSTPASSPLPTTPPRPTSMFLQSSFQGAPTRTTPRPTSRTSPSASLEATPYPAVAPIRSLNYDESASSSTMRVSSITSTSVLQEDTAVRCRSVETQTDPAAFTLMPQTPTPILQIQEIIPEGPYYQVPGREHVHLVRNCWGLRNATRVDSLTMCRCCRENDGRSMYGETMGQRGRG